MGNSDKDDWKPSTEDKEAKKEERCKSVNVKLAQRVSNISPLLYQYY